MQKEREGKFERVIQAELRLGGHAGGIPGGGLRFVAMCWPSSVSDCLCVFNRTREPPGKPIVFG